MIRKIKVFDVVFIISLIVFAGVIISLFMPQEERVEREEEVSGFVDTESTHFTYNLEGKTIVNFGDSIFGKARPPQDISTYISELTGATVYNVGFGGCRMAKHNGNYDTLSMYRLADGVATGDWTLQDTALADKNWSEPSYFLGSVELLKSIDFNKVDIVTISYGTNDFTGGNPIDDKDNSLNTNTISGALRYSIETIKKAYPNAEIVICTPIYRFWQDDNKNFLYDSDTHIINDCKLTDIAHAIEEVAKEYNLLCIDNYNGSGINLFTKEDCFPENDTTHPNEKGREMIAEYMSQELYEYFGN